MESTICPEVLAPAGDMERLRAAVLYGADAVYLGGKLHSMRATPQNFTMEELRTACSFAHDHGVKVYFTCNTLPTNQEVEGLAEFLVQVADCGVDALIVADVGVMQLARRTVPGVPIHISTQAGVTNYLTASELYRLGASRVVLARELTLEDIVGIRRNTPPQLELECFVHGAMCMSVSGRCLLSSYLTGRDANRGECAQPCRWSYHLVEEKRPGEYYPVVEEEGSSYILNAKDMCLLPYLDRLLQAGVTSLKIEGRAKSAYYVAVTTNAYRNAVDLYRRDPAHYDPPSWLLEETQKISHREYVPGFLFGKPEQGQCYRSGGYVRQWDVMAVVEGWEDGRLLCTQRNKFSVGDSLEALVPRGRTIPLEVPALFDGAGEPIASTSHAMMPFSLPFDRPLPPGTLLRRQNP